jgi:hypothetical protein
MKKIFYILLVLVFVGVSCKKQEVISKTEDTSFVNKDGSSDDTGDTSSDDPGIIETEDEDDKKKKGPKGGSSK